MKSFSRKIAPLVVLGITACAPVATETATPVDTRPADEAAIRTAIDGWLAASQAKDIEAFASVYAADAVVMLEGAPDMNGLEAIRAGLGGLMQDPNFSLSFEPTQVVVARAGDLAYETGTYGLSMSDPEGNPASQQGHYVVVWRKEADGQWRIAQELLNADPAAGK